jgi:SAM-dependent methyltransferase
MTQPNPLATPLAWNEVVDGYITETAPLFQFYAEKAISLANPAEKAKVVDIAAGPGTLSLLIAKRVKDVVAIDFASAMIKALQARALSENISNIKASVGDGQMLELPSDHFDAAFSMFGLIFFPSRSRGFREMNRVLKPGGKAVISSWCPTERVPLLHAVFGAIRDEMPGLPFGGGKFNAVKAPLGEPQDFTIEMAQAGFVDISIHEVLQSITVPSMEAFWTSNQKGAAPLVLLRKNLGEEQWKPFSEKVLQRLIDQFGAGEQTYSWPALLGVGTKE